VDGELRVRGGSLATRVLQGGRELTRDEDGFFPTGDLATLRGSLTFINGRRDDLIVGPDGENLNPTLLEKQLSGFGEEALCLLPDKEGALLLVSVSPLLDGEGIAALGTAAEGALERAGLSRAVRRLFFTVEPLLREGEIKLNRRRLAKALADGTLSTFRPEEGAGVADKLGDALEEKVAALFARALEREEKIPPTSHFFRDLGGTSLEYFALLSLVKEEFGATLPDGEMPATVRDFCRLIHNSQ
jgi:acyl carrier protein